MPNSARGVGECEPLIPNQIEINKTLARRSLIVKRYGYPTAVYDAEKIDNPAALQKVGAVVRARNLSGMPIISSLTITIPPEKFPTALPPAPFRLIPGRCFPARVGCRRHCRGLTSRFSRNGCPRTPTIRLPPASTWRCTMMPASLNRESRTRTTTVKSGFRWSENNTLTGIA